MVVGGLPGFVVRTIMAPVFGPGREVTELRNRLARRRARGERISREERGRIEREMKREILEDVLQLAGVPDVLGLGAPSLAAEIVPLDPAEPVDLQRVVEISLDAQPIFEREEIRRFVSDEDLRRLVERLG